MTASPTILIVRIDYRPGALHAEDREAIPTELIQAALRHLIETGDARSVSVSPATAHPIPASPAAARQ